MAQLKNKFCRFCMNGRCYSPEKSYPDDFKDRKTAKKLLEDLK